MGKVCRCELKITVSLCSVKEMRVQVLTVLVGDDIKFRNTLKKLSLN
jgi:hypothetical protein